MRSRIPRATRAATATLPSDRAPEHRRRPGIPSPELTHAEQTIARPRHRPPAEQAAHALDVANARGNLAASCLEAAGVDLAVPAGLQAVPRGWSRLPTTAVVVAGARDYLLLAAMLGLDGAP